MVGSSKITSLITGGAGFIGSELVRQLIRETDYTVINIDKLTYAGNLASVEPVEGDSRYHFEQADICEGDRLRGILLKYRPLHIFHLAAESHVDRSIDQPGDFLHTNVNGTYQLLQASRAYFQGLKPEDKVLFRFLHISTDEVFGSLDKDGYFSETTAYSPRSPYSASKAASDHLVRSWQHTFGLPTIVSNCSNNYGPCQFPEKLIPHMIICTLTGKRLPVYGAGQNVRDWLYVSDHVRALRLIMERGSVGETYNIGGNNEVKNIDVVHGICRLLDRLLPRKDAKPHEEIIDFVADRPGHDFRYAMDTAKIHRELGWRPRENFESGLDKTVRWYLENKTWWQSILERNYTVGRLGLPLAS